MFSEGGNIPLAKFDSSTYYSATRGYLRDRSLPVESKHREDFGKVRQRRRHRSSLRWRDLNGGLVLHYPKRCKKFDAI